MDQALRAPEVEVWIRVTDSMQAKDGVGDVEIEFRGWEGDVVIGVLCC